MIRMGLKGKDLISIEELSRADIDEIIAVSGRMLSLLNDGKTSDLCRGKILANLFFEPSTRTRMSFESAMYRLSGNVTGFSDALCTSVRKGETISDTVRMAAAYGDLIVIRHPCEGAAKVAADASLVPVINAGDGGHQHPTQTLLDIFTIIREKGRIDGLNIGLFGDLKYGRTVHSLAYALSFFSGIKIYCIAPPQLKMPDYVLKRLSEKNIDFEEHEHINAIMPKLDVLYATRIQKERFGSEKEYVEVKGKHVIDNCTLASAKKDMILMHPLPRVDEIAYGVDSDLRAVYFRQASYGVPVRMALIALLLGAAE